MRELRIWRCRILHLLAENHINLSFLLGNKKISMTLTIYTTPTCPWCHKTKEFLKEKKISFQEKNVAFNIKAQQEMIKKSKQRGVPVLDINGKIIVGFDPERIVKAVKKGKK